MFLKELSSQIYLFAFFFGGGGAGLTCTLSDRLRDFFSVIQLNSQTSIQNIVLGALGPVPTAVGNTFKRVVIFVALYYCTEGETFPWPKTLGCIIAIVGCLAYAVFDANKI